MTDERTIKRQVLEYLLRSWSEYCDLVHIIVVGPAGSGKSTFIRALDILYNDAQPTIQHKLGLQQQVLSCVHSALVRCRFGAASEDLQQRAGPLCQQVEEWLALLETGRVVHAARPFIEDLHDLWVGHSSFRDCFQVEDTAILFLSDRNRMQGLLDGTDRLSQQQFLLWRDPTKAPETVRFHRDGTEMVVTALPADGLSVVFEAHKFFQDCTAVIVMNGPSFDAQPDNPWSEGMHILEELVSLERQGYEGAAKICFFTKSDILQAWLQANREGNPDDVREEFVRQRMNMVTSQHDYSIYHHLVVPTNLENIRFIFNACCDIMLKTSLAERGLTEASSPSYFTGRSPLRWGKPKKRAIDNTFADTEAVLDTLANFDATNCKPTCGPRRSCTGALAFAFHGVAAVVWNVLLLGLTTIIALPGMLALLLLRSDVVETSTAAFEQREGVLDAEGALSVARATRWWQFLVRAMPMLFLMCVWPILLCAVIFKHLSAAGVITLLSIQFAAIFGLQLLGVFRAGVSWRAQKKQAETQKPDPVAANPKDAQPTTSPTFSWSNPLHLFLLANLLVELFQITTLPFQSKLDASEEGVTTSSTFAPSWFRVLGNVVYLRFIALGVSLSWEAEAAIPVMLVAVLLALVAWRVMGDIQLYGDLKYYDRMSWVSGYERRRAMASQYLFHSLTGSVLYGHGRPRTLSAKTKLVVMILSDALFLTITQQLLSILRCDYSVHDGGDNDHESLLVVGDDTTVRCWEGSHAVWAAVSLAAFSYYVPISVMLAPMIAQDHARKVSQQQDKITFLKLYSMLTTASKSFMLMLTMLLFSSRNGSLAIQTVVCVFMAVATSWWIHRFGRSTASTSAEPCNHPWFSCLRATVFACGAWSCVWAIGMHNSNDTADSEGDDSTTSTMVTTITVVGWAASVAGSFFWYTAIRSDATPLATADLDRKDDIELVLSETESPAQPVVPLPLGPLCVCSSNVATTRAEFATPLRHDKLDGVPLPKAVKEGLEAHLEYGKPSSWLQVFEGEFPSWTTIGEQRVAFAAAWRALHCESVYVSACAALEKESATETKEDDDGIDDPELMARTAVPVHCVTHTQLQTASITFTATTTVCQLEHDLEESEEEKEEKKAEEETSDAMGAHGDLAKSTVLVACHLSLDRVELPPADDTMLLVLDWSLPDTALRDICELLWDGVHDRIKNLGVVMRSSSGDVHIVAPIQPVAKLDVGQVCCKLQKYSSHYVPVNVSRPPVLLGVVTRWVLERWRSASKDAQEGAICRVLALYGSSAKHIPDLTRDWNFTLASSGPLPLVAIVSVIVEDHEVVGRSDSDTISITASELKSMLQHKELLQALLYPTLASEVTTAITFPVDEVHVLRRTGGVSVVGCQSLSVKHPLLARLQGHVVPAVPIECVAVATFKGPVAAGSDDATVGELSLKGLDMLRDIMWAKQPICLPHAEPASSGNNTVLAYKALWELCSILRQWRCRLSARLSREVADLQVPEVPADPAKPSTAQGLLVDLFLTMRDQPRYTSDAGHAAKQQHLRSGMWVVCKDPAKDQSHIGQIVSVLPQGVRVWSVFVNREVLIPNDINLFIKSELLPDSLRAEAVKALDEHCTIALSRFIATWGARARTLWRAHDDDLLSAAMIRAVVTLATLTLHRKQDR